MSERTCQFCGTSYESPDNEVVWSKLLMTNGCTMMATPAGCPSWGSYSRVIHECREGHPVTTERAVV